MPKPYDGLGICMLWVRHMPILWVGHMPDPYYGLGICPTHSMGRAYA